MTARWTGVLVVALALFGAVAVDVASAMSGPGTAPFSEEWPVDDEATAAQSPPAELPSPAMPPLGARMSDADDAFEYWDLLLELDSGERIVQRFLITNLGPGKHSAIALGHLVTPDRPEPYAYSNGRRRDRWTLEENGRLLDVSASTLDLRPPRGRLRITKDDIQVEIGFELGVHARRVPSGALPKGYGVSLLTLNAPADGRFKAPWMNAWKPVTGRAALVHSWSDSAEADALEWRSDFFSMTRTLGQYLLEWGAPGGRRGGWTLWTEGGKTLFSGPLGTVTHEGRNVLRRVGNYPVPLSVRLADGAVQGVMRLSKPWLEIDALSVLPQPFRFFLSLSSQPHQVWADVDFDVTLSPPSDARPPETIERSGQGVAQITFLNERR